ncbi:MAG TPA: UDP-N-acetylglucosamine 2-epimerase (non-hydrolyzing) [Cytophagales bacterium]|nr:UDP-N-acetylglucosamine 2-epimerase (non-hydrolyzing) [Cytophagales bacterium]HAA18404.1 UDP-N-acetylglucosamine 2-epimerase (non-hydrolyzing) [Cytophagales bacterium]HAP61453.1 UDP-N-acetylglucosamine 2-epimerase (non-hydrolyzing) [Cytophagales bacterium]
MKVTTVIGARPQFIKAAAVSKAILDTQGLEEVLIHTGQHFDQNMSDIFFSQLGIPEPKYNLDIHGGGHGQMTGRMLEALEEVFQKEQPDYVMVYGDTNSTIAGALAAKKLHIPLAHVEAGLRSFNMKMPEEINRILTDRISDLLFCPTQTAVDNLTKEGFENLPAKTLLTGDVMYDAALLFGNLAEQLAVDLPTSVGQDKFALLTLHRAENTDSEPRLREIMEAIDEIHNKVMKVVCPLHPRTRNKLKEYGIKPGFTVIDPVGYLEMVQLLKSCSLVLTDSGGLQKEAYFFEKPCVTLRDETEWVELIDHGYNALVGASKETILKTVASSINHSLDFGTQLYGDGQASQKIISAIQASS